MVFKIRDSRITPTIAPCALTIKAKFLANQLIRIFSQSFCHLDGQPMRVVCFRIMARFLKTLYRVTGGLSHRHKLQCYHVNLATLESTKIVSKTKAFAFVLPLEEEKRSF